MSNPMRQPPQEQMSFRAVVHAEAEGGYWADVPELPGCFTQGQTLDELYQNLTEAVACHLDVDNSAVRISLLEMVSDS